MAEGHTKGPWHIDPKRAEGFYEDVSVLTHGGLSVAVALHNGDITPPTVEANARLIASAPELLDELQVAVLHMETLHSLLPAKSTARATLMGRIKTARDVISKATGGDQ